MADPDPFADFLERLRGGDDAAAAEVFHRFTDRLLVLARAQIESWLLPKVDPEDVVQSVYRSFFARCREGEFDLDNWGALWGLLTIITVRKCVNRVEYFRAERRDAGREVSLAGGGSGSAVRVRDLLDREPTPSEAAVLAETVERLLRGFEEQERQIVELSLQGYTVREISEQLGRAERTVRRVRQFVRERLQRLQAEAV
jgi:RNA polymerase sigma-70 factor (ECF subfamily)